MTKKVHGRHGARWAALQALYAWQLTGAPMMEIEADLLAKNFQWDEDPKNRFSFDTAYCHELLAEISMRMSTLDGTIFPYLDRELKEVHFIERGILWIAFYELETRLEIPYRVIINEAIELAKRFGAQDSHKFINGVLDKAAKELRKREVKI